MKKTLATLAIATVAMFGIAGCASGGTDTNAGGNSGEPAEAPAAPPADQTVDEACAVVSDSLKSAGEAFAGIDPSNLSASAEAGAPLVDEMRTAIEGVGNAEVKDVYSSFVDAYADLIDTVMDDPDAAQADPSVFADQWNGVMETSVALTELCGEDAFK